MSSRGSKVVFQSSLAPFMEQFVRERRAIGRYNTKVELPEQELPRLKAASRQGKRDMKEELLGQHLPLAVLKGISEPTWPSSLLATIVSEPKKPLRASAAISLEIKSKSIDLSEAELRTLHGMLNATVHQLDVEAAS